MADAEPNRPIRKSQRPALSARDVRFARLLFESRDKTVVECYLEAGFPRKATDAATSQAAHRRVKNRYFVTFLRDLQQRAADAAQVDANLVMQGLKRIACAKRSDAYDERGRIKLPRDWSADIEGIVEAVESEELFELVEHTDPVSGKKSRRKELVGYVRKVKFAKRMEALRLLAEIVRLTGRDADAGKPPPAPLVIAGEANPDAL